MSYSIVTTPGFIIQAQPYGEAGKLISIFTRDLGLVLASAQGIRLEKSKLRYFAQEYSFGTFSLVRGREFWRLTDARESICSERVGVYETMLVDQVGIREDSQKSNVNSMPTKSMGVGKDFLTHIALLLRRLLHGEEAHPELFDCISESVRFIEMQPLLQSEQLNTLESIVVARILHRLGYIGDDQDLNGYIDSNEITIESLEKLAGKRVVLNKHINKALKESQM